METDGPLSHVDAENQPLLSKTPKPCKEISPRTVSKIIQRVKAMGLKLLPLQVEQEDLTAPTSYILTKDVVEAFKAAGGDFEDAIPYCLLEARRSFHKDAQEDPSDYDENICRKLAMEVLARKVVMTFPSAQQPVVMSTRYSRVESDGDESLPTSALESAVDQHCPIFLSSDSAQKCVFALWDGNLVQGRDAKGHVVYSVYDKIDKRGFLDHLDPARLGVPRYQNWLKIGLWILFLVCYTIAIQTPDREWGLEDIILYVQLLGYILEDLTKIYKIGSAAAINFWACVNLSIYALLVVAFSYRIADIKTQDNDLALRYRRLSFHILSCAAPLIWMKLLTIFDLFTYFGTLQIVVFRMLRESAIFFTLLLLLAIGFAQALLGLDASDSTPGDSTDSVGRSLIEGLLGSPNFDIYAKDEGSISWPFGMILYYAWTFMTVVILLNVLVALFGSAYQQVTDEAVSQYMAFFAGKCVAAIRAPDQFVYAAPFNLVELLLLPFEFCLSSRVYAQINRIVLTLIFCPALCVIAFFESRFDSKRAKRIRGSLDLVEEDEYDEDPEADSADDGQISTKKFEDLIKVFPNLEASETSTIIKQIGNLKKQLDSLEKEMSEIKVKKEQSDS